MGPRTAFLVGLVGFVAGGVLIGIAFPGIGFAQSIALTAGVIGAVALGVLALLFVIRPR